MPVVPGSVDFDMQRLCDEAGLSTSSSSSMCSILLQH